jgi:predicted dithiol-disulfide oxidoreductase (DUF899 family)
METKTTFYKPVHSPRIVSPEQWEQEQKQYLQAAKELTRQYDALMERRRQLPWLKIEKQYVFEGEFGKVTLADLFQGRNQLVIQHFMFAPGDEQGCVGCSFSADHADSARMHFEHNDLSFAAVSRAPVSKLLAYRKRMGWTFNWVSSGDSSFNYDFNVSVRAEDLKDGKRYYNFEWSDGGTGEAPGLSVFYRDQEGNIFRTHSVYGRGGESVLGAYYYLDMTPKGRNETNNLTDWVRHHDLYEQPAATEIKVMTEPGTASCCSALPE